MLINVVLCLLFAFKITAPLVQPLLTDCVDKPPMEAAFLFMAVSKTCANCGNVFFVKQSHYNLRFSCSVQCRHIIRKRKVLERTSKICSICKKDLPISGFVKKLDGVTSKCRACSSDYNIEFYKNNTEKRRALSRKNYLENRDKRIQYAKEWNKSHPVQRRKTMAFQDAMRRSRVIANSGIIPNRNDWANIKKYFLNKCAYCNTEGKLTVEHFYPIAKGGRHCISNIIPACRLCNSMKNSKMPEPWILKHFTEDRLFVISEYLENAFTIAKLGWRVLRYTNKDYKQMSSDLHQILNHA